MTEMDEYEEIYKTEFKPLFEKGDYNMAAMKLIKNPDVKEYLSKKELIGLVNFYETGTRSMFDERGLDKPGLELINKLLEKAND